ncbi:DUF4253 domain-containing protein [Streptomyces termitum]|uniref:DUF4253 domain-containing protein n=1 Tax=Streptomyces termitum TaxID=67368 RepID=A0A918WBP9_9ACTN|nr:DUF4253 domain-containing protein [Streptomyces termitum]GHA97842.1 hypothetical protein GCM10010305_46580 [Streptomyces termitum]
MSSDSVVRFIEDRMASSGLTDPVGVTSVVLPGGARLSGFTVRPHQAEAVWRYWRALRPVTGWTPVVTTWTGHEKLGDLLRVEGAGSEAAPEPAGTGARVAATVRRIIEAVVAGTPEHDREEEREVTDPQRLVHHLRGPWGEVLPGDPLAFTRRWSGRLTLLLAETEGGYQLPLFVPGLLHNTNSAASPTAVDLSPRDHHAFLRHWYDRYGAEVFFINGTEVQLLVDRPPVDPLPAARLAVEHYAYADELMDVVELGDRQVRSDVWSFWWD